MSPTIVFAAALPPGLTCASKFGADAVPRRVSRAGLETTRLHRL
ncbi:MAG TPA: hypothetical protein VNI84_16245 [Pyrinomonadaceae bacterium]|nr:hypothetical protein [Pyrinomonadaceae bacterium]